ncbi:MAG: hypothetical protein ACLFVT_01585, partial [Syntrophobacteria bacterium]
IQLLPDNTMVDQTTGQGDQGAKQEEFKMYASPAGARFLRTANKIFEDFPTSKYIMYFTIFTVEVIVVFWLGFYLIR